MRRPFTRRSALKTIASVAAGAGIAPHARSAGPNEKLNLACIGVGGRGAANVDGVSGQNLVAFADVDDQRAGKTYEKYSGVRRFRDYRNMLDELHKEIDGVVISTPDHTHFHPAYAAMQLGLHVYLEKPLAHNLWETRTLTDYARLQGIATQLGAQRHTLPNLHRVVELVQSGAIGEVSEVYSWVGGKRGMPEIPTATAAPPPTVDYDLWVGPVVDARSYHPSICPYGWRFWWQFGTGETGNWGCHILDVTFWALGLTYPVRVEATGPEVDPERTPTSMQCKYSFANSNQSRPVDLYWSHGVPTIVLDKQLVEKNKKNWDSDYNTLFMGSKGMLICGFDRLKLLPEEEFADFQTPDPFVPDSPGFYEEWIRACKSGPAATCNFDYAGPLAETVLLGNVAYRAGGFDWDHQSLKTVGNDKAQALVREEYRTAWRI